MNKFTLAKAIAFTLLSATTFDAHADTATSQSSSSATAASTTTATDLAITKKQVTKSSKDKNPTTTTKTTPTPNTTATDAVTTSEKITKDTKDTGTKNPSTVELIVRPANHQSTNFELDFMFPVWQPYCADRLFAIDLRGMIDVRRNKEGNFGGVYRQIIKNRFVLGGYVYADYRRTRYNNNFGQATFGVDALSDMFDGRFNVYLAQNKIKSVNNGATTFGKFTGNNIAVNNQFESAQSGFDGEVGVRIPMLGLNNVETRVFAGGYRFSRSGTQTMAGPRGRLEVRVLDLINPGSRLTLGVDVSKDKVRKTVFSGIVGLRIPMQLVSRGNIPQGLQHRLSDYVYRDVNINTVAEKKSHLMVNPKTGEPYIMLTVKGPGSGAAAAITQSGDGSAENPFTMINDSTYATAANNPHVLTRLIGSGVITGPSDGLTLTPQDGQYLFGPATTLNLQDGNGNVVAVQEASTSTVTIQDSSATGKPLFFVTADNPSVHIAGFTYVPLPTVPTTAALFAGTYSGDATITIRDMIVTGNLNSRAAQINVLFAGPQTSTLNVQNVQFNGFMAPPSFSASAVPGVDNLATGIQVTNGLGAFGGNVTVNTGKITLVDPSNSKQVIGQNIVNNQSTTSFFDTGGSVYSNGDTGIAFQDITPAGSSTPGIFKFTVDKVAITGTTGGTGIVVARADDNSNDMSFTNMTGTISNSVFSSSGGMNIGVTSGGGVGVGNLTLNLTGNQHENSGTSTAVSVSQQAAIGNTSDITVNMNDVVMRGATTGAGIRVTVYDAQVVNTVNFIMKRVTTDAGYPDSILITNVPLTTAGQITFDVSAGGNVFNAAAAGGSFNGFVAAGAGIGGVLFALTSPGVFNTAPYPMTVADLSTLLGTTQFPQGAL